MWPLLSLSLAAAAGLAKMAAQMQRRSSTVAALITGYTMMHGFASLAVEVNQGSAVGGQRRLALEGLLAFTIDGLAVPVRP